MVDRVLTAKEGTPIQVLAPVVQGQKGEFRDVIEKLRREGFVRARIDGRLIELEQPPRLEKSKPHVIEAVIDRLKMSDAIRTRLTDSIELALKTGHGVVTILFGPPTAVTEEITLSNQTFDPETGYRYAEITPRHFSFNSPLGACPVCDGLGTEAVFDPALLVPDGTVRLEDMPVGPWRRGSPALMKLYHGQLAALARAFNEPMSRPFKETSDGFQRALFEGTGGEKVAFTITRGGKEVTAERPFEGLLAQVTRLYADSKSELTRHRLTQYMTRTTCRACHGARLRPEVLAVTLGGPPGVGLNIAQFAHLSIAAAQRWLNDWKLGEGGGKDRRRGSAGNPAAARLSQPGRARLPDARP